MTAEVWAMSAAGLAALAAGLLLVRPRFRAAIGAGKLLVLGPVFAAVSLAIFAAEHLTAAHDLAPIVPRWLPAPLFWVYFFGVALLAAALSFILWHSVRWSAPLLALFFFLVVVTVDLPNVAAHLHDRIFWVLTFRETCFGAGALALAGSVISRPAGPILLRLGRSIVAAVMIFYAIEHFLFPHNVTGVPLEKLAPPWTPAPALIAYFIGIVLLLAGIALFIPRTARLAAAWAGAVLLVLTLFFYGALLIAEFHTNRVEGLNYVGDTLLFAATVLLAGLSPAPQPTWASGQARS